LSLNESNKKLKRLPRKKIKNVTYGYGGTSWVSTSSSVDEDSLQPIKVLVEPSSLDKIDMIWQIVLDS
jgi:hypothetical protein